MRLRAMRIRMARCKRQGRALFQRPSFVGQMVERRRCARSSTCCDERLLVSSHRSSSSNLGLHRPCPPQCPPLPQHHGPAPSAQRSPILSSLFASHAFTLHSLVQSYLHSTRAWA